MEGLKYNWILKNLCLFYVCLFCCMSFSILKGVKRLTQMKLWHFYNKCYFHFPVEQNQFPFPPSWPPSHPADLQPPHPSLHTPEKKKKGMKSMKKNYLCEKATHTRTQDQFSVISTRSKTYISQKNVIY